MKSKFFFLAAPAVIGFLALGSAARAQGPAGYVGNGRVETPGSAPTTSAPSASAATVAGVQTTGSDSDKQITQQIHDAIVADKSLSADARNVKIVTQNGRV